MDDKKKISILHQHNAKSYSFVRNADKSRSSPSSSSSFPIVDSPSRKVKANDTASHNQQPASINRPVQLKERLSEPSDRSRKVGNSREDQLKSSLIQNKPGGPSSRIYARQDNKYLNDKSISHTQKKDGKREREKEVEVEVISSDEEDENYVPPYRIPSGYRGLTLGVSWVGHDMEALDVLDLESKVQYLESSEDRSGHHPFISYFRKRPLSSSNLFKREIASLPSNQAHRIAPNYERIPEFTINNWELVDPSYTDRYGDEHPYTGTGAHLRGKSIPDRGHKRKKADDSRRPIQLVLDDSRLNPWERNERDIPSYAAPFLFHRSFILDSNAGPSKSTDPLYQYDQASESDPIPSLGETPKETSKNDQVFKCFNCGEIGHRAGDCQSEKNQALINLSKRIFNFEKLEDGAKEFGERLHEIEMERVQRLKWIDEFQPGQVSESLRKALTFSPPTGPRSETRSRSKEEEKEEPLEHVVRISRYGYPSGWESEIDPKISMRNVHLKDHKWEETRPLSGFEEQESSDMEQSEEEEEGECSSPISSSVGTPPPRPKKRWATYSTSLFSSKTLPTYDPNREELLPDCSKLGRKSLWNELLLKSQQQETPPIPTPTSSIPRVHVNTYSQSYQYPPPPRMQELEFLPPPPPIPFYTGPPPPPSESFVPQLLPPEDDDDEMVMSD